MRVLMVGDKRLGRTRIDDYVNVGPRSDLVEGKLKLVRVGEARIALVLKNGEVFAVSAVCTHAKIFLAPGKLGSDGLIECPMHGAKFTPEDGSVRCAPATRPLAVHEVRFEDGQILVRATPNEESDRSDFSTGNIDKSAWAGWGN